jgi:hypothetical protein
MNRKTVLLATVAIVNLAVWFPVAISYAQKTTVVVVSTPTRNCAEMRSVSEKKWLECLMATRKWPEKK